MKLIPHSLTPELLRYGIRSLAGVGTLLQALVHSVLYPHNETLRASPKAISESASYLQV